MDKMKKWQYTSTSRGNTLELARALGQKLKGGEAIVLVGDMGSGKTTFVKGLVAGLGSSNLVNSPSFTISNQYEADKITIYHFDFHRLYEPGIMRNELSEILTSKNNVVIIEWADIVKDVLPSQALIITIRPLSENKRQFTFESIDKSSKLIPII